MALDDGGEDVHDGECRGEGREGREGGEEECESVHSEGSGDGRGERGVLRNAPHPYSTRVLLYSFLQGVAQRERV